MQTRACIFHSALSLCHELDEFGGLSDAVQIRIALEHGIIRHARVGSRPQPLDGFARLACKRIDAGDLVGVMVV